MKHTVTTSMTMETLVKGTLKQLFINFQTNAVVSGKTPFVVIDPFGTPQLSVLKFAFDRAVSHKSVALFNRSTFN